MTASGLKNAGCVLLLLLSGCAGSPQPSDQRIDLQRVSFADLSGWEDDAVQDTLKAFQKSCARIVKKSPDADFGVGGYAGKSSAWQEACKNIPDHADTSAARQYFEANFTPYALSGSTGRDGLFTGYYEPLLRGSYKKHGRYTIPLYARPPDLVDVNLGDFKPEMKGVTISGRVQKTKNGARLIPYYNRAEIERGAIRQSGKIVWVDNAVDAFFLHIQGSGLVKMQDGTTLHVGYAAQNGRPYTAIGRELIKRGQLTKDGVSMQSIRAWLESHPDEAAEVMNVNASYVFFRKLGKDGPLGAEGVAITPHRSLAVDRRKIPYGAPIWIDTQDPDGKDLQRLMIAQDTGGAITGAVRGDVFWGAGSTAADKAGRMKSKGRAFILLPKSVQVPSSCVGTARQAFNP